MNKFYLFCLALLMVATISAGCSVKVNDDLKIYNSGESMGQIQQAEFTLNTSFPKTPSTLKYYKLVCPEVSIESVKTLGAKLGFTGEAGIIPSGAIVMSSNNGENWLNVYDTGRIEYFCKHELFKLNATLSTYDDAAVIATNFLKQVGLWFSDVDLQEVTIGGTVNTTPSHLLVQYRQFIDEIPLVGNGTSYAVRIGNEDKVVKAAVWHIELEPQGTVKCIDAAQAGSSLMEGKGINFTLPSNCTNVTIENIYIGYFIKAHTESGGNVMPVYVFEGKCLDSNGNYIQDFKTYIDAVLK